MGKFQVSLIFWLKNHKVILQTFYFTFCSSYTDSMLAWLVYCFFYSEDNLTDVCNLGIMAFLRSKNVTLRPCTSKKQEKMHEEHYPCLFSITCKFPPKESIHQQTWRIEMLRQGLLATQQCVLSNIGGSLELYTCSTYYMAKKFRTYAGIKHKFTSKVFSSATAEICSIYENDYSSCTGTPVDSSSIYLLTYSAVELFSLAYCRY